MKKYKILYIDPPWAYRDRKVGGGIERHGSYKGMSLRDLKALPIDKIADDDCVLFLWATYPMIEEALEVIKSWGFVYKTLAFQWVKLNKSGKGFLFGLGRWCRGNTEPCLLAIKGKPKKISSAVSQLIISPQLGHSAKPPEARNKIIQLMGDLPRIELFARSQEPGWDALGLEIDGKDIRESLNKIITK